MGYQYTTIQEQQRRKVNYDRLHSSKPVQPVREKREIPMDEKYAYSIASLGNGKWLWGVGRWCGGDEQYGRANSQAEADAYLNDHYDLFNMIYETSTWALKMRRNARRNAKPTATTSDSLMLEYVYSVGWDDISREPVVRSYAIIKQTAKRLIIRENEEDVWYISRPDLEQDGCVCRRNQWPRTLYNEAGKDKEVARLVDYHSQDGIYWQIMQLPRDASKDEIKAQYRILSKAMHPDHGGLAEEFRNLHNEYQKAMEETCK